MLSTRNWLTVVGFLVLGGIVTFALAGFYSTVDVHASYEAVLASGILFTWGFGILLVVVVRARGSRS